MSEPADTEMLDPVKDLAVKTPSKRGRANPAAADVLSPTVLYSAEAEKAVLGCMMAQPNEVINDATVTLLKEDFFVPAHQEIFAALRDMYNGAQAIDTIAVHQWLTDRKLAEAVGSPGILAELLVGFANHLNVGSYIRIVKEKSLLRCLQLACSTIVQDIAEMPDSVASVLDRAEAGIFKVTEMAITVNFETRPGQVMDEEVERIVSFDGRRPMNGLPTGFSKLDGLTGGWGAGEMIVLAARPGQGKTALAIAFLEYVAGFKWSEEAGSWERPGHAAALVSLEMPEREIDLRRLARKSSIDLGRLKLGLTDPTERTVLRNAREDLRLSKFYTFDPPRMTIGQLRSLARRAKMKYQIELLAIDYLQLMVGDGKQRSEYRQNEVAEISRGVKALAKELQIPIIILAQLNRQSEKDKSPPALHNLRESGAIEQDADVVLMLHRQPNLDDAGEERHTPIIPYDLIIAKQRNGPTDKFQILFHGPYTRFEEPVRHETRERGGDGYAYKD